MGKSDKPVTITEILDKLPSIKDERTARKAVRYCEDRKWLLVRRTSNTPKAWRIYMAFNPTAFAQD